MKVSIAIVCACFLLLPSCARQNKMLEYYKMELAGKNKWVKQYDDGTFRHIDKFDLITEGSKPLALEKIGIVTRFVKENSKLFYDYSITLDQKRAELDWKRIYENKNREAQFDKVLGEIRHKLGKVLRSRFKEWNDCVRISVSFKSSTFFYDFLEGRQIGEGIIAEFPGTPYGLEYEPNYGEFTFSFVFREDTTKSLDHFLVFESNLLMEVIIPIVYQDNHIGNLTAEFYKL